MKAIEKYAISRLEPPTDMPLWVKPEEDGTVSLKAYINGKWKDVETKKFYSGEVRPQTTDIYVGFQFFDTTLGKPIWWNGTAWVDATGTIVS